MGLFNGKTREEEAAEKLQRFMRVHNLESLDEKDVESAKLIARGLMGNGLIEWGTIFSGKAEDTAKLSYLSAMVEQNWMIINQLDRLNKKLDKFIDGGK